MKAPGVECTPYIVGIGASAGGLNALRELLHTVPACAGISWVIVVHVSAAHESHIAEHLQRETSLPVRLVEGGLDLEADTVYVTPPNANLTCHGRQLRLSALESDRTRRAPIDRFLCSLAASQGEQAIGVILTGEGSDGVIGIRRIREHGGLGIAQDPDEAECSSMPRSAIASGTVDKVLPLREIARAIRGYCSTHPRITPEPGSEHLAVEDNVVLGQLLDEVYARAGQDAAIYSPALLLRRVRRRMRLREVDSLPAYLAAVRSLPDEARLLRDDLLLNVSEFFQSARTFAALERVLEQILERKQPDSPLRVWSIGCSTGEATYSIAILLMEAMSRRRERRPLRVFATELAEPALQHAREGVYPEAIAAAVSSERLQRFFVHEKNGYRVRRELREIVTFSNHDLFKDPSFAHLDVIVCHGLLAKLRPPVRQGVLTLYDYALDSQGALILEGECEVPARSSFERDPTLEGVFHPIRTSTAPARRLPSKPSPFDHLRHDAQLPTTRAELRSPAELFRAVIEPYAPPGVLVDASDQVVHFSPTAARFVRLPGGEPTSDILKLVLESLALPLGEGLKAVRAGAESFESEPLTVGSSAGEARLVVRVSPVPACGRRAELLLVVFDDRVAALAARAAPGARAGAAAAKESSDLWQELECVRQELQTANQELQALVQENQHRLESLAELSNDLQVVLAASGLAMLMVDRSLQVVRFTPLAGEVLNLRPSDIGRPLTAARHRLDYPQLLADLRRASEGVSTADIEVESDDGRWFLVRMQPYHSALRGLEGAVLVLVDISARKRAELALRAADQRKDEFLAILAHELRNPLAPIATGIEVLRKLPSDRATVERIAGMMGRQSELLVRLVDDLLEVSRISQGKLTLRLGRVDVRDVVRDATAGVQPLVSSLEHRLTVVLPEEFTPVQGDAVRLTQVIANLLHNAARYTAPGGELAVEVQMSAGQVEIRVRDNGFGIGAEALPKIFDLFFQAHRTGAGRQGLGIGLTLAKQLIEMHRGTITAESRGVGQGSTFTVRLPLLMEQLSTEEIGAAGASQPNCLPHGVLIVDDNVDAAQTLSMLTRTLTGGEITIASSGLEALELAARMKPDVVLLDLSMPDMDGYEVARRLRTEPWARHALLIAVSGWGQQQHVRMACEAGFDRHMTKPVDPNELIEALRSRVIATVH